MLTKMLKMTVNSKIKMTKIAAKTMLLKRLTSKVIGVNELRSM